MSGQLPIKLTKGNNPKHIFHVLSSVTQLLNELCISGKVQVCWCGLQKLSCLQAETGVKGIKLKDELHICFLPLHHFVQVFWSLKKALFPHSNMYWCIDWALSPPWALPGPGPEPEAPKGLYPHPGIYKSAQECHCSSTPGRKTAGSFLQQGTGTSALASEWFPS